jgi:hypothetical protein
MIEEALGKLKVELNQNAYSKSVCLHAFPEDLELKEMHHIIYLTNQYSNSFLHLICNSIIKHGKNVGKTWILNSELVQTGLNYKYRS